ncbi:MAG: hypothetical protein E6K55_14130 [Gemmatimonadetes bacterium]|nr:MAG: hypothetical protein DMD67_15980 [Gemmatimonadota bacterium]TLY48424.1 MAG: hypothetical protein E6K55_14130 [Gemmatimonadota bacterium]
MPKGTSKSTAIIQRLLEERRQYEAWLARLNDSADATPGHVRARVRSDYEARLSAVTEELRAHAESARQAIEEKRHLRGELQKKETRAGEKLTEAELRHSVGEYDEGQWTQVHADILAELVSVREDLQSVEADLQKLEELDALVRNKPIPPPPTRAPATAPPAPPARPRAQPQPPLQPEATPHEDELAFIKSVTEDDKTAPSPRRASGAQFQPVIPADTPTANPNVPRAANPVPAPIVPEPTEDTDQDPDADKTLRCRECGTMNLPTEWYCKECGGELAAM